MCLIVPRPRSLTIDVEVRTDGAGACPPRLRSRPGGRWCIRRRQPQPGYRGRVADVRSDGAQIVRRRLAGPAVGDDLVSDLLSLVEGVHAGAFDRADVHEYVLAAIIGLDESEALLAVEPFHSALRHMTLLSDARVWSRACAGSAVTSRFGRRSSVRRARRGEAKSFGRSSIQGIYASRARSARSPSEAPRGFRVKQGRVPCVAGPCEGHTSLEKHGTGLEAYLSPITAARRSDRRPAAATLTE